MEWSCRLAPSSGRRSNTSGGNIFMRSAMTFHIGRFGLFAGSCPVSGEDSANRHSLFDKLHKPLLDGNSTRLHVRFESGGLSIRYIDLYGRHGFVRSSWMQSFSIQLEGLWARLSRAYQSCPRAPLKPEWAGAGAYPILKTGESSGPGGRWTEQGCGFRSSVLTRGKVSRRVYRL
jgi:hypothetical protein